MDTCMYKQVRELQLHKPIIELRQTIGAPNR